MIPYSVNIKLAARTLTGTLNLQNKTAVDWGWQGLIAQGCHSSILIIDPKTSQTIQVLERHKANVVKVKWSRENYHHSLSSPYSLRLASADSAGKIIVWDVVSGTAHCEIQEHSKPIQDMDWLWTQDASRDLLLAIHPPNYIVLWNGDTGTKLWKKSYAENILSFSFDPFDPSNLALLTSEGIVFISDFSHSKPPGSGGKKVYIASPHASPAHTKPVPAALPAPTGAKKALNKVKVLITNEKPTAEAVTLNADCLQLSYLPSKRNHMLLLYPREILILDLELSQTVGVVAIERSGVPFIQVIPCAQRDALFCLHENGCITLRVCRSTTAPDESVAASDPEQSVQELVYDLRSQCDAIRVTKTVRPYRMVICPVNENNAALTVSDGRVMLWELKAHVSKPTVNPNSGLSPLYAPVAFCGSPLGQNQKKIQDLSLNTMIGQSLVSGADPPPPSLQQEVQLKFLLTGLLSGLPLPPFALRMCPPLTTKNINHYQPLLAVGTSNGSVLVYNLTSGLLHKDLSVHSCEVKGIEWVSLTSFLSFATSTPNNAGLVRNELQHVDLPTGRCFAFRGEQGNDEPAIEMMKVSHLKQYLVVVFRDKPLELWDVRTGTLLREMAKNFPTVTALEWSPSHNLKSLKKKQMLAREAMARYTTLSDSEQSSVESSVISLLQDAESKSEGGGQAISAREHFVFTDTDGQVYHITVEGNTVKDGARIPPDGSMGSIACIAWKGDTLVLGDVDGNLNFWDLKARLSRGIPTHRGWVKKIRFAPGKGNQKLLVMYTDGAEVWDTKEVNMVSSLRIGRNVNYRILDIDWCTSDKVVLASEDGCIRVLEMAMKSASYRMDEQDLTDPVWCPYLLLPRAALTLKAFLLLQPWSGTFTMDITQVDYTEKHEIKGLIQEQLNSMSNDMKSVLLDPELNLLQRCLLVSRLFGDESDLQFWTVAAHYLQSFAQARHLSVPVPEGQSPAEGTQATPQGHLDIYHDTLCESFYFQRFQLERVHLQEVKRSSYEHTKKCADQLLLLGQTDRAVQLLLETSADNPSYYCDSLKACLVTTITSSGPSQSTIKLVATNMIANGKLAEGVQLLCLIDKAADACRYLQTYGEWNRAAWLAKVRLNPAESSDVLKRWAEHLCSPQVNQKSKAILVLLSLGCFHKVGEMLQSMRYFDRAALFIEACLKYGVMEANDSTNKLIGAAFVDYARLLRTLGLRESAAFWASRAGGAGEQLLEELFQGEGAVPEETEGPENTE
ncbi:WD repeat-containing protein 11 isoform X1 [Salvelinus fontinalis]|uniref:WD repeat-containing protein 11 isoform X1 n=1 Tax=Salvelinus fontinalis TaxID=8038 RepID=UPI002486B80D|nr:WD repeat-containing protein 11 isoform X1 [Salvelinus fontinalis]